MKRMVFPLVVSLSMLVHGGATAATIQNIVGRFFPPALAVDRQGKTVPIEGRHSAFVSGDLNHDGSQLIVVVYWNNYFGAVSVLSPVGDGSVVASIVPKDMVGRSGELQLLDLDRDGRPEIVVTRDQHRGLPGVWIYKWTGAELRLMGPTRQKGGDAFSDLADTTFLDIDGDGTLAVVDHHVGGRPCDDCENYQQFRLFRVQNGDLKLSGRLDCFEQFMRGSGAPRAETKTFSLSDPTAARQLIVINGEHDGSARVSSAQIVLNGQPVVGPSSFNQKAGVIRLPVALAANNTLTVTLDGKPGGTATVLLLPTP